MRVFLATLPMALLALVGIFGKVGLRPLGRPYEFSRVMPSARDYWIEFDEAGGGSIVHKWGKRSPIDPVPSEIRYDGESCRLWVVHPPGLDRDFLVFDACVGAYTLRRIVWGIRKSGTLTRAADFITVGEILGDGEQDVLDCMFLDANQDGIEEVRVASREFVIDVDHWAIRATYHVYSGERFTPKWERFTCVGVSGPLGDVTP